MQGNANGYFRPRHNITRAETATVMNRLLGRMDSRALFYTVYENGMLEHLGHARPFSDVNAASWYFPSVLAATNDHYLTRDGDEMIHWKFIRTQ